MQHKIKHVINQIYEFLFFIFIFHYFIFYRFVSTVLGFFSRLHGLHACIDLQDGVRCSDDRVMLGHVGQVMFAPARYFAVRVTG